MQLRRIVTEFPKIEPISYDFTYGDSSTFEEEVDEWFSYNDAEFKRLQRAKDTFERRWKKFSGKPWMESEHEERANFVHQEIEDLRDGDLRRRCKGLQTILYIILGVWNETAGLKNMEVEEVLVNGEETHEKGEEGPNGSERPDAKLKTKATESQIEEMKGGIHLLSEAGGIAVLYQVLQNAFTCLW
jgi:hypothetical protein